jgi:hypothetical protein
MSSKQDRQGVKIMNTKNGVLMFSKCLLQVVYKTLAPQWGQTLEFVDDGSPMVLHVKDYNTILPTSSIGHCEVAYEFLPPNQTVDRWLPLQGVNKGEIHFQITRRVPEKQSTLAAGDVPKMNGNINRSTKIQHTASKVC